MKMLKFNKISLAALLMASMALVMLPGCSSTEETPATGGDSGGSYDECIAGCADFDCKEMCAQQYLP
jgi:hypothetical protein